MELLCSGLRIFVILGILVYGVNGREDDSDSLRQIVFRSAGDIGLLMERILEQQAMMEDMMSQITALSVKVDSQNTAQCQELKEANLRTDDKFEHISNVLDERFDLVLSKLDNQDTSLQGLRPPYGYQAARVFHASSSQGHYKLTFAEGKALCEAKGAKIATRAQLTTAHRLGYARCSCGWVAEGEAIYPNIWPQTGCGHDGIVGPCTFKSSNTYNVYCYRA